MEERLYGWFARLLCVVAEMTRWHLFPPLDWVFLTTVMSCIITILSLPHNTTPLPWCWWCWYFGDLSNSKHNRWQSMLQENHQQFCKEQVIPLFLWAFSLFISEYLLKWARAPIEVSSIDAATSWEDLPAVQWNTFHYIDMLVVSGVDWQ